jgi:hypothetical protein
MNYTLTQAVGWHVNANLHIDMDIELWATDPTVGTLLASTNIVDGDTAKGVLEDVVLEMPISAVAAFVGEDLFIVYRDSEVQNYVDNVRLTAVAPAGTVIIVK